MAKSLSFLVLAGLIAAAWTACSAFIAPVQRAVAPAAAAASFLAAAPAMAVTSSGQADQYGEGDEEGYLLFWFALGTVALFNAVFAKGGVKSLNQAIFGKDR
jgi:hypothetical protein